jgi:hypothetical protein
MILVVAQGPVDQHGVDRGVRRDDRDAVVGGCRLDHLDRPTLQFLHQCPRRTTFGRRGAELVVHDEGAHAQSLDASLDHLDSFAVAGPDCVCQLPSCFRHCTLHSGGGVLQRKNVRVVSSKSPNHLP